MLRPNMRVTPLDLAIPVIPLDEIGAFLRSHRILGAEELNDSGYVIAGGQDHLITANGDRIFARGNLLPDELPLEVGALLEAGPKPGQVIVVAATNHPGTMIELAEACRAADVGFVDAPVCYGLQGAKQGNLISLCGGEAADIDADPRPYFEAMVEALDHQLGRLLGAVDTTTTTVMATSVTIVASESVLAR